MTNSSADHVPEHEGKPVGPEPQMVPEQSGSDDRQRLAAAILALHQGGQRGANWFFWVSGLSLVNSVILLTGGQTFFVIGLGVTLVADAIATGVAQQNPEIATAVKVFAAGFDLLVALVVAAFGWLARKRFLAVFAVGMALYLLDGLFLFVLFQDWMSVAFHAFALFCMWKGFNAYRQLGALDRALQGELG